MKNYDFIHVKGSIVQKYRKITNNLLDTQILMNLNEIENWLQLVQKSINVM